MTDLLKGQVWQLEWDLGDLSLDVLIRQPQVDSGGVDVSVPELLLEGVQPAAVVQEVDRVPVAEQVSVDISLETGSPGSLLDDLIGPLLGDVTTLPGGEKIIIPAKVHALRIEQDGRHQTVVHEHYSLLVPLTQHANPVTANVGERNGNSL